MRKCWRWPLKGRPNLKAEALERFKKKIPVCWDTLKVVLRQNRFSFRRTRRIPSKRPSQSHRAAVERALGKLRHLQSKGICDLFFGDEAGFCLQPTLSYLWQPKGQTLGLPAQAHSKRLNVLGFWHDCDGRFFHRTQIGRVGATEFIAAVEEDFLPNLQRPAVLVLDNGSLHRAKAVRERRAQWRSRGLRLLFLPPYSPHLNRIETLWRFIKHRWLPPSAYCTFHSLKESVCSILKNIGSKYRITFS